MSTGSLETQAMALLSQALEHPSTEREAWVRDVCGEQSALFDRVMALLAADSGHDGFLKTGGASVESEDLPPPERVGAYQITGLIGQGGMGAVYEGKRVSDNFDHRVAIKVVRPGALSDALTERFQRERQILAALNHPNIARLFDGGEMEDGAPYIVMEYVNGQAITEWVVERQLSIKDRLWLFSDLCSAVRHAHQNLVIHRDITPSNVLVTEDGVVKLIDFGIAKPHSTHPTIETPAGGSLAGLSFTPGYAAPERSAGAAANTLSDVYSLGKILEALTQSMQPSKDLKAIIACASASNPQDRYPSVDALHEDIQNLRSGHSVDARGGGFTDQIGKFVGRHKISSLAGAAALTCLIGAVFALSVLYSQSETNRQVADERFKDSREMATFMLFDLYDKLQPISGNTEALQIMADRARGYLDDLSQSSRADKALELETIRGYHRLANIEGNPISNNLGRRDRSQTLLDLSSQRLSELAETFPNDPDILREQGVLSFSRSVYAYIAEDDNETSIQFAVEGVGYFDALIEQGGATLKDQIHRFDILQYTAKPYIWMEQTGKAVELYQEIETDLLAFANSHPDNEEVQYTVATFYTSFTEVADWHYTFTKTGRSETLRVAGEAIARIDALAALETPKTDYRRSRAIAYYRRGIVFGELDEQEKSIPDLKTAQQIATVLTAEDPLNAETSSLKSAIESQLMLDLSIVGNHEDALALGEQFLKEVEETYESEPDNAGYWRNYFQKQQMVGETYVAAKNYTRGCELFENAIKSANLYDKKIGISDGDRKGSYNDLVREVTACREGRISEFVLEE